MLILVVQQFSTSRPLSCECCFPFANRWPFISEAVCILHNFPGGWADVFVIVLQPYKGGQSSAKRFYVKNLFRNSASRQINRETHNFSILFSLFKRNSVFSHSPKQPLNNRPLLLNKIGQEKQKKMKKVNEIYKRGFFSWIWLQPPMTLFLNSVNKKGTKPH